MKTKKPIVINLEGIDINELSVFLQQGSRAIPEFAASCQCKTVSCSCACTLSCGSCSPAPTSPAFNPEE